MAWHYKNIEFSRAKQEYPFNYDSFLLLLFLGIWAAHRVHLLVNAADELDAVGKILPTSARASSALAPAKQVKGIFSLNPLLQSSGCVQHGVRILPMIIEEFQPLTPVRQYSIEVHPASTIAAGPPGIAIELNYNHLECAEDASGPGSHPLVMRSGMQDICCAVRAICW